MKQTLSLLLAILINLQISYHEHRWMYRIEYQLGNEVVVESLPEDQVSVRLDEEYSSEYYDFLGRVLHISPGRLMSDSVSASK